MSYLAPTSLDDALAYLKETGAQVIAGCTDYYPSRDPVDLASPVLDITRIAGFRGIETCKEGWRIGAATTWTDLVRAPLPPAFDGLKQAAREVGSIQIQNRATLVGNVCNASPAADGVPPLLTLGAQVEISGPEGRRQVGLSEFITGVRQTALNDAELVSALLIPAQPEARKSAFQKLGSRRYLVISIAMVATALEMEEGTIAAVKLAVGSCAPIAKRLPALEDALIGKSAAELEFLSLDDPAFWAPLSPIDDIRGSASYRRDAVAELTRRTLLQAIGSVR